MISAPPLSLLVRKLSRYVPLDQGDQELLLSLPTYLRELKASAPIIREGEALGACSVLVSGFAYQYRMAVNGSRQITSLHLPGDALDMQHLYFNHIHHNVKALTDVSLVMVPRAALQNAVVHSPAIAKAFSISNSIEASICREWLLNVGRRDAQQRVAHLICEVAARLEGQGLTRDYGCYLPMTQEQIGDATALTSVHVNRTLKRLEDSGLIVRSKRTMRVPDWPALKRIAGFNPLYLHVAQQKTGI